MLQEFPMKCASTELFRFLEMQQGNAYGQVIKIG